MGVYRFYAEIAVDITTQNRKHGMTGVVLSIRIVTVILFF